MSPRASTPREDQHEHGAVLRLQGEYWTLAYEGSVVRLRDTRGLRYLEILLRHPAREFHVVDLAAMASGNGATAPLDGTGAGPAVERTRKAVTNRIRGSLARISAIHPTLGLHLTNAVHTGTNCRYTPERALTWRG